MDDFYDSFEDELEIKKIFELSGKKLYKEAFQHAELVYNTIPHLHYQAKVMLGIMYYTNKCTEKNIKKSLEYLEDSYKNTNSRWLASMIAYIHKISNNYEEAIKWYNEGKFYEILSDMYKNNEGVPKNKEKAKKYKEKILYYLKNNNPDKTMTVSEAKKNDSIKFVINDFKNIRKINMLSLPSDISKLTYDDRCFVSTVANCYKSGINISKDTKKSKVYFDALKIWPKNGCYDDEDLL